MIHFRPDRDVTALATFGVRDGARLAPPIWRELGPGDEAAFADHLLRLDERSRRLRFGAAVNEHFLRGYAHARSGRRTTRIGLFFEGMLGGVCELHRDDEDEANAEAAFSLEAPYRGLGHGARMFATVLATARRQGVQRLTLQCLRENVAMRAIARRFAAELCFDGSDLTATLRVPSAQKITASPVPTPVGRTSAGACSLEG